jgi:hypothetical protein
VIWVQLVLGLIAAGATVAAAWYARDAARFGKSAEAQLLMFFSSSPRSSSTRVCSTRRNTV